MVDDAVNICGLKRFAIDHSKPAAPPKSAKPTGRTVAIIGGGPGGLTAATTYPSWDIPVPFLSSGPS